MASHDMCEAVILREEGRLLDRNKPPTCPKDGSVHIDTEHAMLDELINMETEGDLDVNNLNTKDLEQIMDESGIMDQVTEEIDALFRSHPPLVDSPPTGTSDEEWDNHTDFSDNFSSPAPSTPSEIASDLNKTVNNDELSFLKNNSNGVSHFEAVNGNKWKNVRMFDDDRHHLLTADDDRHHLLTADDDRHHLLTADDDRHHLLTADDDRHHLLTADDDRHHLLTADDDRHHLLTADDDRHHLLTADDDRHHLLTADDDRHHLLTADDDRHHLLTADDDRHHLLTADDDRHHLLTADDDRHHLLTADDDRHHLLTADDDRHHLLTADDDRHHLLTADDDRHHLLTADDDRHHLLTADDDRHHLLTADDDRHHLLTADDDRHHLLTADDDRHHLLTADDERINMDVDMDYAQMNEEMKLLQKEKKYLDARVEFLKSKNGDSRSSRQSVKYTSKNKGKFGSKSSEDQEAKRRGGNALALSISDQSTLAALVKQQQLYFDNFKAMLALAPLYDVRLALMTPMESYIHLSRDLDERRRTIVNLRESKLDMTFKFVEQKAAGLNLDRPHMYSDVFEKFGKCYGVSFAISKYRDVSVPAIAQVIHDQVAGKDKTLTDAMGCVTVREPYDHVKCKFMHQRIVSSVKFVQEFGKETFPEMESNCVLFSRCTRQSAVLAMDYIDKDDLHPYQEKNRIRKDVSSGVVLTEYIEKDGTKSVIMKRFLLAKFHVFPHDLSQTTIKSLLSQFPVDEGPTADL